jgi:hypothetical protein
MAIAIRPEFLDPPDDARRLTQLVESLDSLLADYLRRSMLRRESDVPLSTLMRDVRALLEASGR